MTRQRAGFLFTGREEAGRATTCICSRLCRATAARGACCAGRGPSCCHGRGCCRSRRCCRGRCCCRPWKGRICKPGGKAAQPPRTRVGEPDLGEPCKGNITAAPVRGRVARGRRRAGCPRSDCRVPYRAPEREKNKTMVSCPPTQVRGQPRPQPGLALPLGLHILALAGPRMPPGELVGMPRGCQPTCTGVISGRPQGETPFRPGPGCFVVTAVANVVAVVVGPAGAGYVRPGVRDTFCGRSRPGGRPLPAEAFGHGVGPRQKGREAGYYAGHGVVLRVCRHPQGGRPR